MYEQLTQEQRWGFEYAAQLRNDYNASPDNNSLRTDYTAEEMALERLSQIGDQLYAEVEQAKWVLAKQMFDAATDKQKNALLEQFEIPPIIRS
jgi:hypothetical protein